MVSTTMVHTGRGNKIRLTINFDTRWRLPSGSGSDRCTPRRAGGSDIWSRQRDNQQPPRFTVQEASIPTTQCAVIWEDRNGIFLNRLNVSGWINPSRASYRSQIRPLELPNRRAFLLALASKNRGVHSYKGKPFWAISRSQIVISDHG
jgi:hypothetical protein